MELMVHRATAAPLDPRIITQCLLALLERLHVRNTTANLHTHFGLCLRVSFKDQLQVGMALNFKLQPRSPKILPSILDCRLNAIL